MATDINVRELPAYMHGLQDRHNGYRVNDNPYPRGSDARTAWYSGWYDADHAIRWPHLFEVESCV